MYNKRPIYRYTQTYRRSNHSTDTPHIKERITVQCLHGRIRLPSWGSTIPNGWIRILTTVGILKLNDKRTREKLFSQRENISGCSMGTNCPETLYYIRGINIPHRPVMPQMNNWHYRPIGRTHTMATTPKWVHVLNTVHEGNMQLPRRFIIGISNQWWHYSRRRGIWYPVLPFKETIIYVPTSALLSTRGRGCLSRMMIRVYWH